MLLLVDGSNMAFRAFHAFPPLTAHDGTPCNAIYGMMRLLRSLVAAYPGAREVIVAFDIEKASWRKELYPNYKGTRAKKDDERFKLFFQQFGYLRKMVGLVARLLEPKGMEADDAIAWLVAQATAKIPPEKVVIASTDRDLYQLVSPNVSIIDAFRKDTTAAQPEVTPETFRTMVGVDLDQYLDYRCMTGDSSDNIGGFGGIGPVTARKILAQYGSAQGAIDAGYKDFKSKQEIYTRNRRLMSLDWHQRSPMAFEELWWEMTKPFEPNLPLLQEAFEALNFRSLVDDFTNWSLPFRMLSHAAIFNADDCPQMVPPAVSSVPSSGGT